MSFFRINKTSKHKQFHFQWPLRVMGDKRTSLFPSCLYCVKIKASMAVEAALVIPIFLFFIMNILFSFEILRLHSNLLSAMHQTGNKMAFYGYAYKEIPSEIPQVMTIGYARGNVVGMLGNDYLDKTCLSFGSAGLSFARSSIMEENDVIDLIASYKIRPFIRVIGFSDFSMENRYYARAWTGYDVVNGTTFEFWEDPIVFITETGVVYHMIRTCTYLNPSVEIVSLSVTDTLRNTNGEKYYACERCENGFGQGYVYITSQGNRYHSLLQCSSLKRTIYSVHLSEVGEKRQCSKCE